MDTSCGDYDMAGLGGRVMRLILSQVMLTSRAQPLYSSPQPLNNILHL